MVSREIITTNIAVAGLMEMSGEGEGLWVYDSARAAIDEAISADPTLLDQLENDLFAAEDRGDGGPDE
jgi:hypothetical protein